MASVSSDYDATSILNLHINNPSSIKAPTLFYPFIDLVCCFVLTALISQTAVLDSFFIPTKCILTHIVFCLCICNIFVIS